MGNGFQFIDIIFFAMIAAFLVLRLRSVLGRRDGHEGGHADPFRQTPEPETGEAEVLSLPEREEARSAERELVPLDAGLTEIQIADPSFKLEDFLSGARIAFEMILTAFAEGNTRTLKPLLSAEVYGNFAGAIAARNKAGETLERTLVGIRSMDAVEAYVDDHIAHLTVKFVSEQINVIRNKAGETVEGDPNAVVEVTDFWTFARDARARDPNWTLVATRVPE